jgi:hypothetical protein
MAGTIYQSSVVTGIRLSNPATQNPATVDPGVTISNYSFNNDATALYGVASTAWTVTNYGAIVGVYHAPTALYLAGGGTVTNGSSSNHAAEILGLNTGVSIKNGAGTVTNFGEVISAGGTAATSGAGVYLGAGGTVTNESGGYIASLGQSAILAKNTAATLVNDGSIANDGSVAAVYFGALGSVTNAGTIAAGGPGTALELKTAGSVVNNGLIKAGDGTGLVIGSNAVATSATVSVTNSSAISGLVGVAVSGLDSGRSTIVNYGTISGYNGVAVSFGNGNDTLVVEPASTLKGAVANFAPGDTIDFAGKSGSAVAFSYGALSLMSNGAAVATVDLTGAFSASDFSVSPDSAGGTDVTVSAAALPNDLTGDGVSDALMTDTNNNVLVIGEMSGGQLHYTAFPPIGPEWQFEGTGPLLGGGRDGVLLWANNPGDPDYSALVVGEDISGTTHYTQIGSIGPQWTFEGVGALEGGANADFLLENSDGALVVGAVDDLSAVYTQIGSVGPEWSFEGVGNYAGNGSGEFLMWDTDAQNPSYGALVLGQDVSNTAQYKAVGTLDPGAWKIEGTGDLLNDGKSSFLAWNQSSGAFEVGEVNNGTVQFTPIGGADPTVWQFLGVGDYDGASAAEFLMRDSANGVVVLGTIAGGNVSYSVVGNVGPEWNFHGSPAALVG